MKRAHRGIARPLHKKKTRRNLRNEGGGESSIAERPLAFQQTPPANAETLLVIEITSMAFFRELPQYRKDSMNMFQSNCIY